MRIMVAGAEEDLARLHVGCADMVGKYMEEK